MFVLFFKTLTILYFFRLLFCTFFFLTKISTKHKCTFLLIFRMHLCALHAIAPKIPLIKKCLAGVGHHCHLWSYLHVVIYSSAWCECGWPCWQPPQYRDWYTPAGGEGGHLWPDCLGANDVLGVTPLLLKPFDFGCSAVWQLSELR